MPNESVSSSESNTVPASPPDTSSVRGLARALGVHEKSVRKAMARGVFSDTSIRRDAAGPVVINPTAAIEEWKASGRHRRTARAPAVQPAARIVDAFAPVMDDFRVGPLKGTVFIELDRAEHLMFFVLTRETAQALAAALIRAGSAAGDESEDWL